MNPFYDICDNHGIELEGSVFGTAFGGLNEPKATKLTDVKVELNVTLKEFYRGSKKTVRYDRQVLGLDGRTVTTETTEIQVYIRPGMLESQELVFKGKGNEQPNHEPTDLIVSFKAIQHDLFKRSGDHDLIYKHTVSLVDVIQCKPVKLTTLDGR